MIEAMFPRRRSREKEPGGFDANQGDGLAGLVANGRVVPKSTRETEVIL